MLLKSLDKYIKDKVQGYKPPLEEDLWKGIEEKLPAPRVPNGVGSWLLPVAAVVVIAILTPFTIKFYNITGRSSEIALKNTKPDKEQITTRSNNNRSDQTTKALTSVHANLSVSNNSDLIHKRRYPLAAETKIYSHKNFRNISETSGRYGLKVADQPQNTEKQSNAQSVELASNEKVSGQELMDYISPENSLIESSSNDAISGKSDTRYPDRKNSHPLKNDRWENWQSIYYPFWDNPAYTGSEGKLNISADFKTDNISQPGSNNSRNTYTNFGIDGYFSGLGLGIGFYRLSELSRFSLENTYGLALSKSVLQMGSTCIKVGVSGNLINDNIFFNELNYSDQINPVWGFINPTSEKNIEGTTQAFGINGGVWISNPHLLAGLDVANINQPKLGFSSDALALTRQWRTTIGYRFAVGSDFQLMPMTVVTRENKINQFNAMLTAVYKDKYMLSVAYQNIDPVSGLGNAYIYGAVSFAKRFRVFASYGQDMELVQRGINETFVHAGIKCLALR